MKPTYLRRIEISNFRAYGNFSIALPGPGVTILTGPNGLGKSTFFEAIEWALTGSVRRLNEIEIDQNKNNDRLARRDNEAPASQYGVSLEFTDTQGNATKISRRSRHEGKNREYFVEHETPPPEQVLEILRAASWPHAINDLGEHLRLTHLLSQSPIQRFTSRKPREQWDSLRGPAGTAKVDLMTRRLGTGTSRAFTDHIANAEIATERDNQQLLQWRDIFNRRAALANRASALGGMSSSEVDQEIKSIREELSPYLNSKQPLAQPQSDIPTLLADTAREIEKARALLREQDGLATRSLALTGTWIHANQHISTCEAQHQASQTHFETLSIRLAESTKLATQLSQLDLKRSLLQRIINSRASLPQHKNDLDTLSLKITQLTRDLAQTKAQIDDSLRVQRDAAASETSLRQLQESQAHLADIINLYNEWSTNEAHIAEQEPIRQETTRQKANSSTRIGQLRQSIESHRAQLASATAEVRQERKNAEGIHQAIALIASSLTTDDTTCPICSTSFATKGHLQRIASSASDFRNERLTRAEQELRAAQDDLARLEAALNSEIQAEHQADSFLTLSTNRLSANQLLRASIHSSPFLSGTDWSVAARTLTTAHEQLQDSIEQAHQERARMPDALALAKLLAELRSALERQSSELLQHTQLHSQAEFNISLNTALLAQNQILAAELGETPQTEQRALDSTTYLQEQTLSVLRKVSGLDLPISDTISHLAEETAVARSAITQKGAELQRIQAQSIELQKQWAAYGLPGMPSEITVEERRNELARMEATLAKLSLRRQFVADAWLEWQQADELRRLDEVIRAHLSSTNLATTTELDQHLESNLARSQLRLAQASSAKRISLTVAQQAQQAHEVYSANVLKPLEALVQKYLLAISAFPDLSLEVGARTRYGQGQLQIAFKRLLPGSLIASTWPLPASVYLSEGQMSSLGVALLFSMSTAYKWSKWPALLLDDPLQHHDLIHTSAFVEVLRNIVRDEKYQIILSTHDEELADYMRRKMHAADILCTTCRYAGIGPNGVICDEI